jgi:hypothetical protein
VIAEGERAGTPYAGLAGLATPVVTGIDAADAAAPTMARHACTKTSTGHCIAGGQFCPQAAHGHAGNDSHGRKYVCKGNHTHPHWMLP